MLQKEKLYPSDFSGNSFTPDGEVILVGHEKGCETCEIRSKAELLILSCVYNASLAKYSNQQMDLHVQMLKEIHR